MKTKIIPFDLETAKKIQAREIEGSIKTRKGDCARIVCLDRKGIRTIVALVEVKVDEESSFFYTLNGKWYCDGSDSENDLVLEVPDDEPQFKPFDRVLVRNRDCECWHPSLYATTDGLLYYTIDCKNWQQCIPYEGNQELIGTTNEPKED